jgi:hypothetical protein
MPTPQEFQVIKFAFLSRSVKLSRAVETLPALRKSINLHQCNAPVVIQTESVCT